MKNSLVPRELIWAEVKTCANPSNVPQGTTHLGFLGKCRRTWKNAWCSYGKRDPSRGYYTLVFFERPGRDIVDSPILTPARARRIAEKELNRARLEYLKKYYR